MRNIIYLIPFILCTLLSPEGVQIILSHLHFSSSVEVYGESDLLHLDISIIV
jgi:hypothetical protein